MIKTAFRDSIPVLFGYLPLGAAFGVIFSGLDQPWYYATLSGFVVFAGAAQFLSISLLGAKTGFSEIFMTVLALNIRHVFYGFSLLKRYKRIPYKPYLIFGLTDETYSVLTSVRQKGANDARYCFLLTAFNHLYWTIGCTLGAVVGRMFQFDTKGFEFVLLALFTVLMIEQWFVLKKPMPFLIGAASSVITLVLIPKYFLFGSMALTGAMLAIIERGADHES